MAMIDYANEHLIYLSVYLSVSHMISWTSFLYESRTSQAGEMHEEGSIIVDWSQNLGSYIEQVHTHQARSGSTTYQERRRNRIRVWERQMQSRACKIKS